MRRSSHRPIDPAYYIEDCRISNGKSDSTSRILTLKFSHAVPSEHKTYNSNSEQKSEI